jgi:hypothetical protein
VLTKHINVRWHWLHGKRDAGMLEVIFTKSEITMKAILSLQRTPPRLYIRNMQRACAKVICLFMRTRIISL